MNQFGKIEFRKIKRISPSQYFSMKNCAYKSLLAEAFGRKPLLPVSPNAYFGTVLHKILELISKGAVKNENDLNRMFDEQVKSAEGNLKTQGYDAFIPFQKNVKDFGMKKVLLKKHLRALSHLPLKTNNVKYNSEKWFESKDKLIAGKIDLVIEVEQETEIIDFKTGSITEDILDDSGETFTEVKEEYKEQLKLYAYLYYENIGKFPTALSLVDLAKQKFSVSFSQPECNAIFNDAKKILHSTNESISKGTFAANPSEANCKYCLYRPACSFFIKELEGNNRFNDASGLVKKVISYQNGNVSLFIESGERKITIIGFPSTEYSNLNNCIGKLVNIFNLRREATEFAFSWTKTTVVYEQ